jgi:hypothetical protein
VEKKSKTQGLTEDIQSAPYKAKVERGILELCEDLHNGKMELKIHLSKNLYTKFYLCLPKNTLCAVMVGLLWAISEARLGLAQPPSCELNVAMKDYDEYNFLQKRV